LLYETVARLHPTDPFHHHACRHARQLRPAVLFHAQPAAWNRLHHLDRHRRGRRLRGGLDGAGRTCEPSAHRRSLPDHKRPDPDEDGVLDHAWGTVTFFAGTGFSSELRSQERRPLPSSARPPSASFLPRSPPPAALSRCPVVPLPRCPLVPVVSVVPLSPLPPFAPCSSAVPPCFPLPAFPPLPPFLPCRFPRAMPRRGHA